MSEGPVIAARALERRFDSGWTLGPLDLDLGPGEIVGLVGPDGAGKTTTLRLLAGLLAPSGGRLEVLGHPLERRDSRFKAEVGYMAQRLGIYQDLSVEENLRFYGDLFGLSGQEWRQRLGPLLEMTRMDAFRTRRARHLSGGMKQKLALVRTLLHRPRILLLDEPTNGVDPVSRRDFWSILHRLIRQGMSVVVATAYLDEAERCHRVGLMHDGRLLECAAPREIKEALGRECYRVRCSRRRAARRLLEQWEAVEAVHLWGSSLHVFLRPNRGGPAALSRRLQEGGLETEEISRTIPSLEDIFILRLEQRSRPSREAT